MNKDNSYSFASFIAQGGLAGYGENFRSIRIFGSLDDAQDYARNLVNAECYDYAYVSGVYADGSVELKNVIRVADEEPSMVDLNWND